MDDKNLFPALGDEPEPRPRPEAAGRQPDDTVLNTGSPSEDGEEPVLDEQAKTREQIIDEAIEETFPASDPPFWMPQGY